MDIHSKLIDDAVYQFSRLPGVGRKTALRYVLHLLKRSPQEVSDFSNTLVKMRYELGYCDCCHNVSEKSTCDICASPGRDKTTVCVVEDIRDVIAIENTRLYKGVYHVLGGIISPMDGIGPSDLNIESLVRKVSEGKIKEIILALSPTMEGDTTGFYLFKKVKDFDLKLSVIARGISVGNELEYADEVTLGRSILNRTPYENSLQPK